MDFAAAFTRDPQAAPYPVRCDATAAAVFAVLAGVLALTVDDGRPDLVGWALLLAAHVPLAWRRKAPCRCSLPSWPSSPRTTRSTTCTSHRYRPP